MATANDHSFSSCYVELCRQQRLRPLPMICVTLPHSLDFTTDRVKMDDWAPILNSLSLDRTLRSISVRSKYQYRKLLEHANSESKARAVGKSPVVLTRFLLEWLSHSAAQCVRNSSCLTSLELEGIPIPPDCLAVLCVGVAGTKSLQHLSLQRCYIGDAGCELICRTIADVQSIRSLNLSQCDLTSASGPFLASALSRQKLALYQDAWKQSLRYREPKLESMPGLRRLSLNGNTKLGNEAVMAIFDSIRDSLWFKAIDLQQCGLTESIGQDIFDLLHHNKTLIIVDVRMNTSLREDTISEIYRRLERNDLQSKSEFQWLNLSQHKDGSTKRVSSAGNLQKQKQNEQDSRAGLTRPKSAIIRQVKRPPAPIVYRKPLLAPVSQIVKRIKIKPPLPHFEKRPKQPMKPPERAHTPRPEATPKVSLHLDLQAQIQSLTDTTQNENVPMIEESVQVDKIEELSEEQESGIQKLKAALRELEEVREERDRLKNDIDNREMVLAEERARREFAEAKLRTVKDNLITAEQTLQQRELDSRGYLLISQKSMEEIWLTFTRLLDMLEKTARKTDDGFVKLDSDEESLKRESLKRNFARIVRKTQSENLKRGYFIDNKMVLSRPQLTARYGRSEGNIRTTIEPLVPAVRVERNIGDTSEVVGLPKLMPNYRERQFDDVRLSAKGGGDSSGDRVRQLFSSIVNADASFNFGTHPR